jgi:hypothetical protein
MAAILLAWLIRAAFMGLGQSIYDYQTLLGAAIAVGAAYWAGRPVYEQLKLTQTQADGVLREMLLQRQDEVRKARGAVTAKIRQPLSDLAFELGPEEPIDKIDEHQAHHHEMGLWHALSWLRTEYQWRDSSNVEAAKNDLVGKMDALIHLLAEVRYPASEDQHDPDNPISDDDWAALVARGEAAKDEVPAALAGAQAAFREFLAELEKESTAIDARHKSVNEALIQK